MNFFHPVVNSAVITLLGHLSQDGWFNLKLHTFQCCKNIPCIFTGLSKCLVVYLPGKMYIHSGKAVKK